MNFAKMITSSTSRERNRARSWHGHAAAETAVFHAKESVDVLNAVPDRPFETAWQVHRCKHEGFIVALYRCDVDVLQDDLVGYLT